MAVGRCSRCKSTRDLGEFKTCGRCRSRERYEDTPAGRLTRRRYYLRNREKIRERERETYRRTHPGSVGRAKRALDLMDEEQRIREG